jgi:hypothetical protein
MVKICIIPIVGIFSEVWQAKAALAELHEARFDGEQLGAIGHDAALLRSDGTDCLALGDFGGAYEPGDGGAEEALIEAGVGGLWLVGVAAGELPHLGPFIAGGHLANLVATAALTTASDALREALADMGLSNNEAQAAEQAFRSGHTLLTIQTDHRRDEAVEILQRHGAVEQIGLTN